ncbi:hypothetical protein JTB14_031245 [Gonioctena quinquepunctata]|nr:hypothetical protein JTB14_031245 [Gonioctena quinquepunctata]
MEQGCHEGSNESHEISVNAASKHFFIPEATLRRYVKKYADVVPMIVLQTINYRILKNFMALIIDPTQIKKGRTITLQDIAPLFGQAYLKAASIQNAINGFKACEPFYSNIFSEVEFMAAKTTERPDETREAINPNTVLQHIENRSNGGPDHFKEDRPYTSKEHLESHEKQHVTPKNEKTNDKAKSGF